MKESPPGPVPQERLIQNASVSCIRYHSPKWARGGCAMRRLLNPEIALGFLAATVLWIGVLGWRASYAPTDSEKRQCEETARNGGFKAEECKSIWERTTTDPVAFF